MGRPPARALAIALLVLTIPSVGLPHDHTVPRAYGVVKGMKVQRGYLLNFCWGEFRDDYYVMQCSDGPSRWPAPKWSHPTGVVFIDLMSTNRPSHVRVKAAAATLDSRRLGPWDDLSYTQERRRRAWRLRVELPLPCRSYYMRVSTVWRDADLSDAIQDATWQFHFRRPFVGDELVC